LLLKRLDKPLCLLSCSRFGAQLALQVMALFLKGLDPLRQFAASRLRHVVRSDGRSLTRLSVL
jgi:hypothetical protein